jgi:hypothetical protein
MSTIRRLADKLRRSFRRDEAGFAMIVVLVAILVISVLGAASMLLMVSSLKGIVNMKPEKRAFQVAETGLNVGHTLIVESKVGTTTSKEGNALGGSYAVTVSPIGESKTDFSVTSTGRCVVDGKTYTRKLQEQVYYSGEQAYDAMRNYMFFAARDLNLYAPGQQNNYPIVLTGNMRAENNLNVGTYCYESTWDYLVINGSLEARNAVNIEAGGTLYFQNQPYFDRPPNPLDSKGMNLLIYGDIKAGSTEDTTTAGSVNVYAWSGDAALSGGKYVYVREHVPSRGEINGITSIFAATDGASNTYDIYTSGDNNLYTSMPTPPAHDKIYLGTHKVGRTVRPVYIPKPSFEYYKALAQEQDTPEDPHYFDVGPNGTAIVPRNIKKSGVSSMSVYYCTGNFKLVESIWQDDETNGIFVCEGTFTTSGSYEMKKNCKFQIIAGGDVNMGKDSDNRSIQGAVNQYFFYAKRDVNVCLTHFDHNFIQATALRDVNLTCDDEFSYADFNYQAPQVDVTGWPIDVIVTGWKEMPVSPAD